VIVGIKPDGWMATAEHLKFHALALDINGKPKAGQKIVVKAMQREYFSHRRRLIAASTPSTTTARSRQQASCARRDRQQGLLICDVKHPPRATSSCRPRLRMQRQRQRRKPRDLGGGQ